MIAAHDNQPIPLGWALDADGQPATDPKAGLAGSMLPADGAKGAMLEDDSVRRRRKLRDEALKHGVEVPEALIARLRAMSGVA